MDVTIPPSEAQRLCTAAGVLTVWFPRQQARIDRTLELLLAGQQPVGKLDRAFAQMMQQRSERQ